jgi:hypothetical protein
VAFAALHIQGMEEKKGTVEQCDQKMSSASFPLSNYANGEIYRLL